MSAVGGNSVPTPGRLRVRLREVDSDFLRFVPEDEREQAGAVTLPAIDLEEGQFDPKVLLSQFDGCCGVLLSGMVNRRIELNEQVALRVLGPGAVIPVPDGPPPEIIVSSEWGAIGSARLAVVGEQFMRACARWPQLYSNLMGRFTDQNEQLAAQLVLCQLPRVEDRLLGMLWLLAESWGKVTSAGTLLPLHFTHEALGAMVGARRPTVTLALGELAERGAVVQRDLGWLLLELPPQSRGERSPIDSPVLLNLTPTEWAHQAEAGDTVRRQQQELIAHITRLREEHERAVGLLRERIRRAQATRGRASEVRDRVLEDRQVARRRRP